MHSAASSNENGSADQVAEQRPECMQILGLLPPYSLDDIHKAYKFRAASVHPDKGGLPEEFVKIQQAYEQAQQHLQFRRGRRDWMANLVEPYIQQQKVVEQVRQRRGKVEIETIDWMQHSFGDFATLTERLRCIDLRDTTDADEFVKFLEGHHEALRFLDEIDLTDSDLTDAGLVTIGKIQSLKRLNLAKTRVTASGLTALEQLPDLTWLNLAGVSLNWWDRRTRRRRMPKVEVVFQ